MLTPRQRVAYDFIESFRTQTGYAPSYDEIRRHLGLASLNAVAKLITQLRRRGHLVPAPPNAKRWLEPVRGRALTRRTARGSGPATIPRLGTIAAGRPIEPVETPEEIEAAWREEVERRVAAAERGETTFVDAEEVLARMRQLIR